MVDKAPPAAEGAAGSQAAPQPAKAGFFSSAEKDLKAIEERLVKAVEAWYARHFHKAASSGASPITAEDKASLIQHVTSAVQTPKE